MGRMKDLDMQVQEVLGIIYQIQELKLITPEQERIVREFISSRVDRTTSSDAVLNMSEQERADYKEAMKRAVRLQESDPDEFEATLRDYIDDGNSKADLLSMYIEAFTDPEKLEAVAHSFIADVEAEREDEETERRNRRENGYMPEE